MPEVNGKYIRLIACDLDGTLLGPGDLGLEIARQVVRLCKEKNVAFTIATGRVYASAQHYLDELAISAPAVTNGGAIISWPGKEPCHERTIDIATAREIVSALRPLGMPFYYLTRDNIYTEWDGPETAEYSRNISFEIKVVPSILDDQAPTQIAVRVEPERAEWAVRQLETRWSPKVRVVRSLPHLIEIQPVGVSKGRALELLCSMVGVSREEVLAIGDSLNDLDMLAWSGVSAAVGNAHPIVARCAQIVSQRKFTEGVLEIIQNFV